MSLTMFSAIIENVEIAGNTKAMKQSQFEINHLQRRQSTGIVYEVELVAKWTVISINSRETFHREINNELSNKNTANFTLQYVYNEKSPSIRYICFKESTNTRCGIEKVLLAIKQFSIEYRPNIESNGLIIDKKSTVLPVTSKLLIDVSLKSNAQLHSASCKKESISKSETIVTQLIKSYLHKDHTLYVVFILLNKNGTNACEIVRKRRKGVPIIQNELKN
ncbi:piggyBac transposable element-derived protein 4-like [Vespula maculifrons]|uniref:PiggyBac transposable element-derived protein 4-like n=1 Tax=Vespula maculifrons TaxID=7453 RepID=A0ABD2CEZ2_VESMC